ncbi:DFP2 [Sarcoptes scabiei]|nr:DFP2 [Sarcoptes scabiei]
MEPQQSECKVIPGTKIADKFLKELARDIKATNAKVKLVSFLANNDFAAEQYANVTKNSCAKSGIIFELRKVDREQLEDSIIAANEDDSIHGILVYYPVFGGGHDQYIQNCVSPLKDVEGLCHLYRFNMYRNIRHIHGRKDLKSLIPCTPLAAVKVLEGCDVYDTSLPTGEQLKGKTITVINRSEVVGRPLAALLANDGAKVYSVDINDILIFDRGPNLELTKYAVRDCNKKLEEILPISDIVITGVPSPNYRLPIDLLKDGVIAINFACAKNIDDEVRKKAKIFVPAIGKVTTAMLQRNLLRLYNYRDLNYKLVNGA